MTTEAQERKPRSEWDRNCVAHCTAGDLRAFRFWDGDSSLAAERSNPAALQGAPDSGRIVTNEPRYSFATEPSRVEPSKFVPVHDSMAGLVLLGRKWAQVSWAVVCLDPISVVDFLMWEDPSDGAVFIGIDVIFGSQSPVKGDVAVAGHVSPTRLVLGERLPRPQIPKLGLVESSALAASATLQSRVRHFYPADFANDGVYRTATRHNPIVLLDGACNGHFTGLSSFDAHRVSGECQEPSSVRFGERSARAGEPVLQALSGRCAFMPGCWQNGKLVKRVEPVDIWQMSVRDIEQGALF